MVINKWTEKEIQFLKENYPQKGRKYCADFLNRTPGVVKKKAGQLKLRHKSLNYIDRVFGRLTLIEELDKYRTDRIFKCRCCCGNTKIARLAHLLSGNISSCGCKQKEWVTNRHKSSHLVGKKKFRLLILERTDIINNRGGALYKCQCDCRNIVYYSSSQLHNKTTKGCGCLN